MADESTHGPARSHDPHRRPPGDPSVRRRPRRRSRRRRSRPRGEDRSDGHRPRPGAAQDAPPTADAEVTESPGHARDADGQRQDGREAPGAQQDPTVREAAPAGPGPEEASMERAQQGPLIHVAFRGGRVEAFTNPDRIELREMDHVIVEAERGIDLGRVVACDGPDLKRRKSQSLRAIVRHATEDEVQRLLTIMEEDRGALEICRGRAGHFKLDMKVIDAETQFDGNRVTFYFTADHRVDFRELVRDLASIFRTRIELRQVGARDAARRCEGMGICGRILCCNTFLREFEPVTLKMAKEQNLSLNPTKISGACGRLMCCLTYECAAYQSAARRAPRVGSRWEFDGRECRVKVRDIGNHKVVLEDPEGKMATVDIERFLQEAVALEPLCAPERPCAQGVAAQAPAQPGPPRSEGESRGGQGNRKGQSRGGQNADDRTQGDRTS